MEIAAAAEGCRFANCQHMAEPGCAVKAAVDAGVRNAEKVGEVVSSHVIARPHTNVDLVLPLGRLEEAEAEAGTGSKKK